MRKTPSVGVSLRLKGTQVLSTVVMLLFSTRSGSKHEKRRMFGGGDKNVSRTYSFTDSVISLDSQVLISSHQLLLELFQGLIISMSAMQV